MARNPLNALSVNREQEPSILVSAGNKAVDQDLKKWAALLGVIIICGGMYTYSGVRIYRILRAQEVQGGTYQASTKTMWYYHEGKSYEVSYWMGSKDERNVTVWVDEGDHGRILGVGGYRPIPAIAVIYIIVATLLLMGFVFHQLWSN